MNADDAERVIEEFEEIQKRAAEVATNLVELDGDGPYSFDAEEIQVEDGGLYARWEDYVCGSTDRHSRFIPLEYLFDEDWMEKAEAEIQKKREAKAEKKRLAQAKAKRDKETRERDQYLKLKAKFEGGK